MSIFHSPVMFKEVLDGLNVHKDCVYIDLTFGGGGHSKMILEKLSTGHLYAFDQDNDTEEEAKKICNNNFTFIKSNYKYLRNFMSYYNVDKVSGIFADLGVSSHQIDTKDRGFSFRFCADLDMRMNINIQKTAKDVLRKYSESKLEQVFKEYGDLFNAERIAHVICQNRRRKMINTTFDLKNILLENIKIPFKYQIKFLAKVFQALRIEVNNELDNLKQVLLQIDDLLETKGRFVVLSYHSLEDRIVKIFFKENKDKFILITKKPLTPSKEEVRDNTRSRSAKLRIYEKI